MKRYVLLDRDGTLVRDTGHPHRPKDYEMLPGVGAALRRLTGAGFRLAACRCDDRVFDGRGAGTFWHGLTALAGAGWDRRLAGRFTLPQKLAARLGGALDRAVFATHWEQRLGRSGIIVATFVREEEPGP